MEVQPNALKAVRALLIVMGLILLVRMAMYVFTIGQPFAFYKDLGVNFITISYATHDIHSLRDVLDTIGWSPWYDQPLFNLNPYLSYLVAVPLAYLLGNAWFTIKVVQTLQFAAAFGAMYWACRELRLSRIWAAAAALAYAVLPATALAVRGNLDIGWTAVGAPLALAAGLALIRRYSIYALPLVAVVCSLLGFCIAIEYLLFVSVPLYFVLAVSAYDDRRRGLWFACAAGGAVALASTGAYFLFPSIFGSLFSDSSARTEQLTTGSILPLFSQTWDAFAGFVPRESLVSPVAVYNATPSLWIAQISGSTLGALALCGLVWFRRRLRLGSMEWLLLVTAVLLAYLTLGTYAPLGDRVWAGIGTLPLFDAVRTPDRFIVLPAIVAIVWGFRTLEALSKIPSRIAWAAPAILTVVLAGFLSFDLVEHCLANQTTIGQAEPDILKVNDLVAGLGPRTVSFALVNGGSPFDYPAYGVPTDTAPAVTDWESRYLEDGIGAVGLMQRAGVKSVIATPMWATADAPGFPNAASVYRDLPLAPVMFHSAHGVVVSRLPDAAPPVRSVRAACFYGGPGLLDQLLAVPAFADAAFETPKRGGCAGKLRVLADYSPYDALTRSQALVWLPGSTLFPGDRLQDADYRFLANRVLLNDAWYRNSVDGDRLIFDAAGAARITKDASAAAAFSVSSKQSYEVLVRMAVHSEGRLSVAVDGKDAPAPVPLAWGAGMRWYDIPVGVLSSGAHTLALHIADPRERRVNGIWRGIAVDGAAVVSHAVLLQLQRARVSLAAQAVSLNRVRPPKRAAIPVLALAPTSGGMLPFRFSGIAGPGEQNRARYLATDPVATLDYRYEGAAGRRVLQLAAYLPKRGDMIAAEVRHANGTNGPSGSVASELDDSREAVVLNGNLVPGDVIHVTLYSRLIDAGWRADFLGGTISGGHAMTLQTESPGRVRGAIDFTRVSESSPPYAWAGNVTYTPQGVLRAAGQTMEIPLDAPVPLSAIDVHAQTSGTGSARIGIACGEARTGRVFVDNGDVSLHGSSLRDCRIAVRWLSGAVALASLDVYGAYADVSGSMRVWIPAGRYSFMLRSRRGRVVTDAPVRIDGGRPGRTLSFASSGFHELTLERAPVSDELALLVPAAWPAHTSGGLSFARTGALRDRVTLAKTRNVEVEHLNDGNWALESAAGTITGRRCDLLETCFDGVPPATYTLVHRYPKALVIGLLCTALTLVAAAAFLLLPLSDRHGPVLGQ